MWNLSSYWRKNKFISPPKKRYWRREPAAPHHVAERKSVTHSFLSLWLKTRPMFSESTCTPRQNMTRSSSPGSRSWWGAAVRWGSRWVGSGGWPSHTCRRSGNRRRSRRWRALWRSSESCGTTGSACCRGRVCRWRLGESPWRRAPAAGGVGAGERAGRSGLSRCPGCRTSTTIPGTEGKRSPARERWTGTWPRPSLLVTSAPTLSAPGCKHKSSALWVKGIKISSFAIGPKQVSFIFFDWI